MTRSQLRRPLPRLELTKLSDCRSPLIISVLFEMSSQEHVHNLDLASQPKKVSIVKLSDASSSCEILICEVHLRQLLWYDLHNDSKNSNITRKVWNEVGAAQYSSA